MEEMWFRNSIKRVGGSVRFAAIPALYPSKPWIDADYDIFERLKIAVTPSEYEAMTDEFKSILLISSHGMLAGLAVGGIMHSLNHFTDFMKKFIPSQYKDHWEAKDALRKKLQVGSTAGALAWSKRTFSASLVFAVVLNFVPVIRNKIDWHEHVAAGVVGGAVAGVLHSNPKSLGFKEIKAAELTAYRKQFITKSTFYGLLLGIVLAGAALLRPGQERSARAWAEYRKKRNIEH